MHKRAYRPEVQCCLENRSLLSGVAGLSPHPTVLTRREFNLVPIRVQSAFFAFRQGFGISTLHDDIFSAIAIIPSVHVDGLVTSINGILKTLKRDQHAKVPGAVSSARNEVLAAIRAHVQTLAQRGDVVVR
jgi:hypothetical protein